MCKKVCCYSSSEERIELKTFMAVKYFFCSRTKKNADRGRIPTLFEIILDPNALKEEEEEEPSLFDFVLRPEQFINEISTFKYDKVSSSTTTTTTTTTTPQSPESLPLISDVEFITTPRTTTTQGTHFDQIFWQHLWHILDIFSFQTMEQLLNY